MRWHGARERGPNGRLIVLSLLATIPFGVAPHPSPAEEGESFGTSVAAHGDLLVVGAINQEKPGAAYLFRRNNDRWTPLQRLAPAKSTEWGFAKSVAIEGEVVVVGHFLETVPGIRQVWGLSSTGAAYVFEARDGKFGETETQILTAPQPDKHSGFGESVAINRQTIAVGSPADSDGAVFVYQKRGAHWKTINKLRGVENDEDLFGASFGKSIAMSDRFLVVGAPTQPVPDQGRTGVIYVYRRKEDGSIIDPPQMLTALPDQKVEDLGQSVAIYENAILAGAPGLGGEKLQYGGALLFTADADGKFQTEPAAMFTAFDGKPQERAGHAVALTADFAFVGATQQSKQNGCVYVLPRKQTGKGAIQRLLPGPSRTPPRFGCALWTADGRLFVGAHRFDNVGQVATFTLERNGQWKSGDVLKPFSPGKD